MSTRTPTRSKVRLPDPLGVFDLPITSIRPGPNDRRVFNEAKLAALASSLSAVGLVNPIAVTEMTPGDYMIIGGERRWRAAQLAGMTTIAASVYPPLTPDQLTAAMLAENTGREDLNPIELGEAFIRQRDLKRTDEEIAASAGVARSKVALYIRLMQSLGATAKEYLLAGLISDEHATTLCKLDHARQQVALRHIVDERLSVYQTREFIGRLLEAQHAEAQSPMFQLQAQEMAAAVRRKRGGMGRKALRSLLAEAADAVADADLSGRLRAAAEQIPA